MLPLYRNENDRKKIYKLLDSSVTQQEKQECTIPYI